MAPPADRADLVAHLLDPARRSPVVVVDPRWPAALREQADRDVDEAVRAGRLAGDDLVLFTSGSTGRPRGVTRTTASWTASLAPLSAVTGIGAGDRVWVPGPSSSTMSLYAAVHAAWAGATLLRSDPRTATAAHLVPTALADAVRSPDRLPALRTVVVAGDALPAAVRERATGLGWRVVEYYGAAELSFVGVREGGGPFADFPGADVEVRDGRLWARSPYLATGYLHPHDAGPLVRDGAWAGVGDLGRVEGDGWLVLGRGGSAVVTGGATVLVHEVEAVLSRVEGVQAVAVVGLPHPRLGRSVGAVVVADRPVREALVRAATALPAPARPRRWWAADRLPLTPAGKVARDELVALTDRLPPLP